VQRSDLHCDVYVHNCHSHGVTDRGETVRVVGYVRVSTDRQAEDGQGLPVQEKAVRAWCRTHGHRLVAIYRDDAFCGRM
jgi:hypothetical protein